MSVTGAIEPSNAAATIIINRAMPGEGRLRTGHVGPGLRLAIHMSVVLLQEVSGNERRGAIRRAPGVRGVHPSLPNRPTLSALRIPFCLRTACLVLRAVRCPARM